MKRKGISMILAGLLALTGTTAAFGQTAVFSDVSGTPYEKAAERLFQEEILSGYGDGTFRPENTITRAEACVMVTKAMDPAQRELEGAASGGFEDVKEDYWGAPYIDYAASEGVISGYPDGSFRPEGEVTYYEMAAMLVNAAGIPPAELEGQWPENYDRKAQEMGLYEDMVLGGAFDGNAPAIRGNVAIMTEKALSEISRASGESSGQEASDGGYEEILAELEKEYGVFNASQTGTMHSWEDAWFDPYGVMGSAQGDFDADGQAELFVAVAQPCGHISAEGAHIMLYMYDRENGKTVLADSMPMGEYIQDEKGERIQAELLLQPNYMVRQILQADVVKAQGHTYIMCENHLISGVFADGSTQSYWLLEYTGGKLQFAGSFTQMGMGSAEFSFTGYDFEKGSCKEAVLYYSEWQEEDPLYHHYGEALKAFFGNYGIAIDSEAAALASVPDSYDFVKPILSAQSDSRLVFRLLNTLTETDWMNGQFSFSASLKAGK